WHTLDAQLHAAQSAHTETAGLEVFHSRREESLDQARTEARTLTLRVEDRARSLITSNNEIANLQR
ncbi:hypothetical protein, partial [Thermobifida halotolerans]